MPSASGPVDGDRAVNLTGVLGKTASDLGLRFNLLGILPVGLLLLFLVAMQKSGAFTGTPDVAAAVRSASELGAADSAWAAVAVLSLAVMLQPLQISLVRLLEGYWGQWWPGRALSAIGVASHQRKRQRLQDRTETTAEPTPEQRASMADAAWRLQHFYPARCGVWPDCAWPGRPARTGRVGWSPCRTTRFRRARWRARNRLRRHARFRAPASAPGRAAAWSGRDSRVCTRRCTAA